MPPLSKDQTPSACMKERERKSSLQTSQPASMEKGKAGERESRPATETYNYDARTGLVPATPRAKTCDKKKVQPLGKEVSWRKWNNAEENLSISS